MTYSTERVSIDWKRFSLREALLAVVAISALLALYNERLDQKRSVPSKFMLEVDEKVFLQQIYKDAGLPTPTLHGRYNGSTHSGKSAERMREFSLDPLTSEQANCMLLPRLRDKILTELEEAGYSAKGHEVGAFENDCSFRIDYSDRRMRGGYRANAWEISGRGMKLVILHYEY